MVFMVSCVPGRGRAGMANQAEPSALFSQLFTVPIHRMRFWLKLRGEKDSGVGKWRLPFSSTFTVQGPAGLSEGQARLVFYFVFVFVVVLGIEPGSSRTQGTCSTAEVPHWPRAGNTEMQKPDIERENWTPKD